jgi:hypothetical protein
VGRWAKLNVKRLIAILFLFALCLSAQAYVITTVTICFTNTAFGTSNYMTITANADTRKWTNQVFSASTQILTNSTQSGSASALFNHLAIYPFSGVSVGHTATTNVVLTSGRDAALAVTVSSGWATLITNTTTYVSNISVVVQDSYTQAEKTNVYSGLAADLLSSANTNRNFTNISFFQTNSATGEWCRATNNLVIISNAVNGKYVSLSNGVVTATTFSGALSGGSTTATYTTGNGLPLTNTVNGTNLWSHYNLILTNDETHSYVQGTNDAAIGTNAPTGEFYYLTNGHALLTAGLFLPTNALNTGTYIAGKNYETNISGNITLGPFAQVPLFASNTWGIWIFVTNSSGTDRTVTFPSGTKELGTAPAVFTVTNQQTADFFVYGWGNKKTNVAWYPHY